MEAQVGADGVLNMPARSVKLPAHASDAARRYLATERLPAPNFPALEDKAAWKKLIGAMDNNFARLAGPLLDQALARATKREIGGADVYVASPVNERHPGKACLSFHGGALIIYGGRLVGFDAARSSDQTGCLTWSVDYGMPPDQPYPGGLDQSVEIYRELLKSFAPKDIIFNGVSAGGNMAAATALKARDEGLPIPAAIILRTPELDLTESGDSFATHMGIDNVLPRTLMTYNRLYAEGADLAHPYLSPLFGDFTLGFPRAFLQAGTRDLFLSNTVRMHRALLKAGIAAELHVWEAMPHAGFGGTSPEDAEMSDAIGDFVNRVFEGR